VFTLREPIQTLRSEVIEQLVIISHQEAARLYGLLLAFPFFSMNFIRTLKFLKKMPMAYDLTFS